MSPGANTPGGQQTPEEEGKAREAHHAQEVQKLLDDRIRLDSGMIRSRIEGTVEKHSEQAEKALEKCKTVHGFLSDVRDLASVEFLLPTGELTTVHHYVELNPSVTPEDRKQFQESMEYLDQKKDAAEKWATFLESVSEWDKGEISLTEFKNAITNIFTGVDFADDPVEQARLIQMGQEKIDIVNAFCITHEANWNQKTFAEQLRLRKKLNEELGMKSMLQGMDYRLEEWKEVNELVKNALVKMLPQQPQTTTDIAKQLRSALDTTFKQWNENTISMEDFRAQMEKILDLAGIQKDQRLAEIDKVLAQWAGADAEKKKKLKEKLHHTIGVQHIETLLNRRIVPWAEERLKKLLLWEAGQLPNSDFAAVMQDVYTFEGDPNFLEKIGIISDYLTEFERENLSLGNTSQLIEWRGRLKNAIGFRSNLKNLQKWASVTEAIPAAGQSSTQKPGTGTGTPESSTEDQTSKEQEQGKDKEPPKTGGEDSDQEKKGASSGGKEKPKEIQPISEIHAHQHGLFKKMGIEFYSINDIIGSLKRVKEAYGHAWHERGTLKQTGLADAMGKMIPGWSYMGGEVKLTLEKANDSEKNKETNEFKEYLEQRDFTFGELFVGHGEVSMAHLINEPPKARAVLEYAASRGWLYDIVDSKNAGKQTILGFSIDNFCSDWGSDKRKKDNYFIKLLGQNSSGQEHEISKGKKKEHYTEKAKLFIDAIDTSIEKLNFWEAVGIAQRSIERGLAGEISPWIAMTVMRHLTENEQARKYVNREVIDQFGLICLGHSARTLANLKNQRGNITDWVKDPEGKNHIERIKDPPWGKGFGKWTKQIQNVIIDKAGTEFESDEERKKLYHLTAQILAGQVVEVKDGVYVTIFDPELVEYPRSISNQGDSNIKNEDDDYFRNVSDVVLADKDVFKRILDPTGSGSYQNGDKATNFLQVLVNLYEELQEKTPGVPAENFRQLTNQKLQQWFQYVIKEPRSGPLVNVTFPTNNKSTIVGLFDAGLLDQKDFDLMENFLLTEGTIALLYKTTIDAMAKDPTSKYHDKAKTALQKFYSQGGKGTGKGKP